MDYDPANTYWISICMLILVLSLLYQQRGELRQVVRRIQKRRKGGKAMSETLQQFLGRECVITLANGSGITGVVKAIDGNWVTVQTGKLDEENINLLSLDYIMRIREYPKNKNGKRKSVIF